MFIAIWDSTHLYDSFGVEREYERINFYKHTIPLGLGISYLFFIPFKCSFVLIIVEIRGVGRRIAVFRAVVRSLLAAQRSFYLWRALRRLKRFAPAA